MTDQSLLLRSCHMEVNYLLQPPGGIFFWSLTHMLTYYWHKSITEKRTNLYGSYTFLFISISYSALDKISDGLVVVATLNPYKDLKSRWPVAMAETISLCIFGKTRKDSIQGSRWVMLQSSNIDYFDFFIILCFVTGALPYTKPHF